MSYLNLVKKLQPAKKVWKLFTSKLHSKLHKLNKSKSIKKPKTRLKTTSKPVPWPALTFQPRFQHKRRTAMQKARVCYRLQKRSAPVYVDKLFIEHLQPPATVAATSKVMMTEKYSTCPEMAKICDHPGGDVPGPSNRTVEGQEEICAADDMWESLGLASPLMHGINERAEEFITRIRAEMQIQETLARRL